MLPPESTDPVDMLRIVDETFGEAGYFYPADYFEPLVPKGESRLVDTVTIHLDPYIKGILHTEAIAADKSVSALLRDWIDERLAMPVTA